MPGELTAGEALIALRATTDGLRADMTAASKLITGELQKVEKSAGSINIASMVTGLNQGLQLAQQAVRATVATFDILVGKSVEVGDEINRVSQAYGVSAEALSGIKQAAGDVDVSFSEVQVSLKAFSNLLSDAASKGGDAAVKVAALGIDIGKLKDGTLSTEDAFRLAIDSLAGMEDGFQKTALQADAFGKAGSKFAVAFRDGSKSLNEATQAALAMGTGFDKVATESAAKLDDQLDELRNRTSGLSLTIGKELTPAATDVVRAMNDWLAANQGVIREAIDTTIESTAAAFRAARDAVDLANVKITTFLDLIRSVTGEAPAMGEAIDIALRMAGFGQVVDGARNAAAAVKEFGAEQKVASAAAVDAAQKLDQLGAAINATNEPTREQLELYAQGKAALDAVIAQYPAAGRAVDAYRAKAAEAASVSTDLTKVLQSMKGASSATVEGVTNLARASGVSAEELRKLDETGKASDDTLRKIAGAMGVTVDQVRALVGALKPAPKTLSDTGDAATKTASALADAAQKSAQFAQAQIEVAAQVGDATLVQDAYVSAMDAAGVAYQKALVSAEAAAAAGKSAAEVQAMQTAAFEQYANTVNANASNVGAFYAKQEQDLRAIAQAEAAVTIAHDMEALAAANAQQVSAVYQKTIEDITAAHGAEVVAIEAKRGVTLSATEADLALLQADEKTRAEMAKAEDQYLRTTKALDVFGRAIDDAAEKLASGSLDLAEALVKGQASWEDAALRLGGLFADTALDEIKQLLMPGLTDLFKGMLSSTLNLAGSVLTAALPGVLKSSLTSAATSGVATAGGMAAGGSLASAVGSGFAAIGGPVLEAVVGQTGAAVIGAGLGSAAVGAAVVAGVAGIGLGIAAAFGAFDGPDMQKRISRHLAKMIEHSFDSPAVHSAVAAALDKLGFELTSGIERVITQTPISGAEVRAVWAAGGAAAGEEYSEGFRKFLASEGNGINNLAASDLVNLYFPGLDAAGEAAAVEAAKAAGAAAASLQGLTGPDALVFAEQFAASLANVAHVLGMTDEEFLQFVEDVAGKGAADFAAGLDALNGAAIDALGPSGFQGLLDDVEGHMETVFGVKNIDAGNLLDLFIQSGASAEAFAAQLERMAETNPELRRLIDQMDPSLVDALSAVEDGATGAAKAIGKITGQANTSLAAVEERIRQFGAELYETAEDGTQQLSALGEELNRELVSGISGIEDAITEEVNSAAGITTETLGRAFEELKALAALPAEALDESTVEAIEHLKAVIQAATGFTSDQIDAMIATAAEVPSVVPPVPPEVTATIEGAADATGEVADNSQAAADASQQLTEATQATASAVAATTQGFADLSTQALTALAGIYGTPDDEQSLSAVNDLLGRVLRETLDETTGAVLGATGTWHDSIDYVRGAVLMLTEALREIPTDITTTIHVVQDGAIPTPIPASHSGELIPGLPGSETLRVLEAGELVLPADITASLMRGSSISLPADIAARLSPSMGAPALASAPAASAPQQAPARDSDLVAVRMSKWDAAEAVYAPIMVMLEKDSGDGMIRHKGGKVKVHPHLRARARRG